MADNITPELSRLFNLDKVGTKSGINFQVKAGPSEREALAKRFDLVEIKRLEVIFTLAHGSEEATYEITGTGKADVVQSCVVTLKDVPAHVEFTIHVIAQEGEEQPIDENDLSFLDEEIDREYYQNNQVDLGEIASQYLVLSLDPYPHAEGAEKTTIGDSDKVQSEIVSPFSVLQKLKK